MNGSRELLVVGAGLTGSLTANLLSKAGGKSSPVDITVWDKARGAGGRMATHRHLAGPSPLHVDMGAQYISRFKSGSIERGAEFEKVKEQLYDELLSTKVLVPIKGKIEGERKDLTASVIENYFAPKGINSIVKHLLSNSTAKVKFQHQLDTIELGASPLPKLRCTATNGETVECDGLVLTMPVPQILSLGGNLVQSINPDTKSKLESVRYSSRYALGLFYGDSSVGPSTPSHTPTPAPEWSAKYFDDPVVRFASWGLTGSGDSNVQTAAAAGRSLLVHTGVPFGIQHLEADKSTVEDLIIDRLTTLIPGLPDATHSHLIRWRYSQVSQAYPGTPGSVVLSHDPLVVATGDGFTGSNFENSIGAALSTTTFVT